MSTFRTTDISMGLIFVKPTSVLLMEHGYYKESDPRFARSILASTLKY